MLTKVSKQPTPVPRTQGNTSAWITVQGRAAFSVYTQAGLLGQNVQIQVRGVLSDVAHIEEVWKPLCCGKSLCCLSPERGLLS